MTKITQVHAFIVSSLTNNLNEIEQCINKYLLAWQRENPNYEISGGITVTPTICTLMTKRMKRDNPSCTFYNVIITYKSNLTINDSA